MTSLLALLSLLLCALLAACSQAPQQRAAVAPESDATPSMYRSLAARDAVVDAEAARDMISLYRRNNGLGDLALDNSLRRDAQRLADDMARPGAVAPKAASPILGKSSAGQLVGLTAGYHTLAEAFSGWRQSPPHNARMLAAKARRMGLATAYAPKAKYKVYWALVLAE